jgi:hypothetical protein
MGILERELRKKEREADKALRDKIREERKQTADRKKINKLLEDLMEVETKEADAVRMFSIWLLSEGKDVSKKRLMEFIKNGI